MSEKVFHCRGCGACCRWEGIVRVSAQELTDIAEYLQMTEEEFRQRYTLIAFDRKSLILTDREDGACVFLTEDNRCQIHPVKPLQCRTFPEGWSVPPEYQQQCQGEYR